MPMINFSTRHDGAVGVIEIDRPNKRNALSTGLLTELDICLNSLANNSIVRAAVISATGSDVFVAGGDIAEMADMDGSGASEYIRLGQRCTQLIERQRFPVIAAVHGHAYGGGLDLAMACDIIVAADCARLGLPEVTLGIIPGFGGTQRLTRRIGQSRAQWLILTGMSIDAPTARDWGLVHQIVAADQVRGVALDIADRLSTQSATALSAAKRAIAASLDLPLADGLIAEASHFQTAFAQPDRLEGLRAFTERRSPSWPSTRLS